MRVVAGTFKSRALRAPKGSATRPTSDRVRESLFAVLGDVRGVKVLDLYSGSGALAIEALSRGAQSAVCVEHNRLALAAISDNRDALGLRDRLEVVARRVSEAAKSLVGRGPFDVILADPPWADLADAVTEIAKLLDPRLGLVSEDTLIVLEHAARDAAPTLPLATFDETRRWGDTAASFYRVGAPSAEGAG
ncbi:MAG: 16S rRNA (guanine(966)-N(2))-methyltransferase RsmD [Deltaproteobacteria bacterium]|nr:16S rRNA (guanine(966)-N(2))-methyltransferase RsmD [Deltaproteobacteria bacterium]